jgi:hypothetical protein
MPTSFIDRSRCSVQRGRSPPKVSILTVSRLLANKTCSKANYCYCTRGASEARRNSTSEWHGDVMPYPSSKKRRVIELLQSILLNSRVVLVTEFLIGEGVQTRVERTLSANSYCFHCSL